MNENFIDSFGRIVSDDPEANYIDVRVEVSDFRNLLLVLGAQLKDKNLISTEEYMDFAKVHNTTVRGDILGKSVVCRVYKNSYAIANSKPPEE